MRPFFQKLKKLAGEIWRWVFGRKEEAGRIEDVNFHIIHCPQYMRDLKELTEYTHEKSLKDPIHSEATAVLMVACEKLGIKVNLTYNH